VAVDGTPFTLSFDLTTLERRGWRPTPFLPTPTPRPARRFFGNNGFYTGVPNSPALYQTTSNTTSTLNFTNFQVTDSRGVPATDWGARYRRRRVNGPR